MNSGPIIYQVKGKLTPNPCAPATHSSSPFQQGYVVKRQERKGLPGFMHQDASVILLARMEQEVDAIRIPFHPILGRARLWPISPNLEVGGRKEVKSHCACFYEAIIHSFIEG